MYIIQTNTSYNDKSIPIDFQSMMYEITKETWEEFKEYILSDEEYTDKIIKGTMWGSTKPRNCKILDVLINDDHHLEVIISKHLNEELDFVYNSKFYMVTDEQFNVLK